MNEPTEIENLSVKVVNLINFHGLTLWVVEHEGLQYIPVKPLADMANVDWRSAKKTVFTNDNAILYGTKHLNMPVFAAEGGNITPSKKGIYIRLDRSRMYLARIDTSRMRSHGKEEAATRLLNLQIEWAEVLNKYEQDGVVYKKATLETEKSLRDFYNILKSAPSDDRLRIKRLIDIKWDELGISGLTKKPKVQGELEV